MFWVTQVSSIALPALKQRACPTSRESSSGRRGRAMSQGLWAENDPQLAAAMAQGPQARSQVETDSNPGIPRASSWERGPANPLIRTWETQSQETRQACWATTYTDCEVMNSPCFEPLFVGPCVWAVTSLPGGSSERCRAGPSGDSSLCPGKASHL